MGTGERLISPTSLPYYQRNVMFKTIQSESRRDRSITTRFLITDDSLAVHEYEGEQPFRPALEVSTSHDKDRKMLITSITRIMVNNRIVRWKMELRDEDPAPVNTYVGERIARYSEKALENRHGVVVSNIASVGVFSDLLDWASRATI